MTDTVPRQMTRADILSMAEYGDQRLDRRKALVQQKKDRRVAVGPDVMFYFESYSTMWFQIHEMLFIERGGEDQISESQRKNGQDQYQPALRAEGLAFGGVRRRF